MKCRLTLQEKLKDLRVEHGLSLEQLADAEIIKDLQKSYARETETAPDTSIVEGIKSDFEAYRNFKGSRSEKNFFLMCKRLGINYSKVPDDEKMAIMRFLRRSKNFKLL